MNQRAEVASLPRPAEVMVVALGPVAQRLLAEVGDAVRDVLRVVPRAGPLLDRPRYALNEDRGQYHTPAILRRLSSLRSGARGAPVLGVAEVDLFVPDASFVIGDTDRDAGAAIFSLFRLGSPDLAVIRRRGQIEAIHAAGHLLGLSHCTDHRCPMSHSEEARDTDRKGALLCAACRAALGLS